MKHPCLPQTKTPEQLADWIMTNNLEIIKHIEETELDEDQVHELESQSSLASRAIDRLENVKKGFMDVLTEGTPDEEEPFEVVIPPTKGLKILKANRLFADKQLEQGFREEAIDIYMIPYPEHSLMVAVDIMGNEWPQFTKDMTIDQINQNKPMLRIDKKSKKKDVSFMEGENDIIPVLDL